VGRLSGRQRLFDFLDAHPDVDALAVLLWAIALSEGELAEDSIVTVGGSTTGDHFTTIVPGTDVQVAWRVLATGTPRLLWLARL
jgi:hypothetical protein